MGRRQAPNAAGAALPRYAGLRIGLPREFFPAGLSADVDAAVQAGRAAFEEWRRWPIREPCRGSLSRSRMKFAPSAKMRSAVLNARADTWHKKGDFQRAAAEFDEAIRLDPNSMYPLVNRGNLMMDFGQFDRAIADFTRAIKLAPTSPRSPRSSVVCWLLRQCSHSVSGTE